MDPRSGIPWQAVVCAIGALVVVCGLSAVGGAVAAPEPSMLRPDAPPSGAVVSPIPDEPIRSGEASDSSEAPATTPAPRQPVAPARARHPVAHTRAQHTGASATKRVVLSSPPPVSARAPSEIVLPRRGHLPDSVRAFLASPIARVTDRGPDRGITALAGTFLALVALGAGCLTVAVGRAAQER
jgi:hypothetical protein